MMRIVRVIRWPVRALLFAPIIAMLLLGVAPLSAQQTGQVIVRVIHGQTGEPLANVQVTIRDRGLGGVTNNQGQVLIQNVPLGEQIVIIQLIGYGEQRKTITVTAQDAAPVLFQMFVRAVELEGVVVTGTAIAAQRRELGNSMSLITADQIAKSGAANFEDLLRGRALGVQVTGSPGQAGAGSDIILRGIQSVNGRNSPLIYVDGVRIPSDLPEASQVPASEHATFFGSINPADIERIEIIKGAAASTLYGTEASAGVIQIFTKKGVAGAPRWTLSTRQGISRIGHVGPDVDPTGLHVNDCTRSLVWDSIGSQFSIDNTRDPGCPASGSWLRDAHVQDYQLSARGGVGDVTYFFSGGWNRQNGVIAPQAARQLSLRANVTFTGLKNLQITINNSYSRRDITWIPAGDTDEGFLFNVARGAEGDTPGNNDALVLAMELDQFINHFTTGANINWTPSASFRHRLNIGLDFSNSHNIIEEPWQYWDNPEGSRSTDIENRRLLTFDYAGSWHKKLPATFASTFSWGGQYNQNEHLGLRGDVDVFIGPGDKVLQNGEEFFAQEDRTTSESGGFFFQEQIGWNNRLFITGGYRADTHSAFGDDYTVKQRFTLYPKIQGTYTLSDHAFWPDWWETFRLRAAYGESGDPPGADDPVTYFQPGSLADEDKLGFIIQNQGNPNIGPERSKEFEAGVDGSLFGGRFTYQLTGYKQKTFDGRIFINPPPSNGIAESVPQNVGQWDSRGWEAQVEAVVLDKSNLRFSVNGSYQFNETKMIDLGSREFEAFNFNYLNSYRAGYPLPALFGRRLLNADSLGQLPIYSTSTTEFLGPTRPPHEIGLGLSATMFERLTLDVHGVGQYGHLLYDDLAQEMAEDILWPPCIPINARFQAGDFADIPTRDIAKCADPYSSDGVGDNEDWAEPGDYFRLQSATLSYRIPESLLSKLPGGLTGGTLQVQATNLFLITNFSGLDPDALLRPAEQVARGAGYILPPPRTYALSVRVNF